MELLMTRKRHRPNANLIDVRVNFCHKIEDSLGINVYDSNILYELLMEALMESFEDTKTCLLDYVGIFEVNSFANSVKFTPSAKLLYRLSNPDCKYNILTPREIGDKSRGNRHIFTTEELARAKANSGRKPKRDFARFDENKYNLWLEKRYQARLKKQKKRTNENKI
jgi:hypothetical protein